jgi:probable blue pigment (indigoidine) exporter
VSAGEGRSSVGISGLDIGLLATVAIAWGSAYIFIREGIVSGASPILFAAVRYALSAVAFAGLALVRRDGRPGRRALLVSAGIGGILVIGLYGGLLYWGEQYTTGGYASVLSSTAPILTVVFALAILPAERLRALSLAGIAVGFAGTVVLVLPDLSGSSIGAWPGPEFILGAFVCAASGTVLLRRFGGGPQTLWQIGTQFAVAGLLLFATAGVLPVREAFPASREVLASLAALVLLSSVLGYFVYFQLHHRVGPVRANVVAYLLPLVGIGLGSGFFGEPVTVLEVVGFAIVLVGVTLVVRGSSSGSVRAASR